MGRVDVLDVHGVEAAITALLDRPETLDAVVERWAADDPCSPPGR